MMEYSMQRGKDLTCIVPLTNEYLKPFNRVNRIVLVDEDRSIEEGTRVFDKKGLDIFFSLQDEGRTLKIFVNRKYEN